jgi:uncharacterized membrane protein YoaT (DUF817 family)
MIYQTELLFSAISIHKIIKVLDFYLTRHLRSWTSIISSIILLLFFQSGCYVLDNVDEKYEFSRLKQSMEMVGFTNEKQRRLFAVLSAVLLLGIVIS